MNERIAAGEIFVGLDDEKALAGLRRVEYEFGRTMQRIEHEEATVELKATEERLKRDLKKAEADVKKYQAYVKAADTKYTADQRKKSLQRQEQSAKESRAALKAHQAIMRAKTDQAREEARTEAKREAIFRRQQQRDRILEQAERRKAMQMRQLDQFSARMSKQREREMQRAHSDALRMNKDFDNQAIAVARLQRQYAEAHDTLRKLQNVRDKMPGRLLRRPAEHQKIELDVAAAEAKMAKFEAELRAMGHKPIHQEVDLDVNGRGIDLLEKWGKAVSDTTVRVGPFTSTIAGLSRALLLLGPILSALVGQAGALVAVLGAGAAGAIGVTAGAVGALGVSLGGVAFLIPSMLRDFKNLKTLQAAYHKQVLKTGVNSDKAKKKLKEYNHALGAVSPTTRRAFLSLDGLQGRWRSLNKEARPTFFHALGESIKTVDHDFQWFHKNTLGAFAELDKGWTKWMRGLRSGEADRILKTLGRNGNRSIAPLMSGIGHLGTVFGHVAAAFSKYLPGLFKGFDKWALGIQHSTGNADVLDRRARLLIGSMKAVGHWVMAAARAITAFFAPGVDDGTKMVNQWADGLNRLARHMRGSGRGSIDTWFKQSIDLAHQFWSALKPLAQVFFEWTTIMRPWTSVALTVLGVLSRMVETLSNFGPTRAILVGAFGVFLYGALVKRVVGVGEGLWSIYKAITAIKTAGGIGAAIKGSLIKFATGGLAGRGTTPANPLFVQQVGSLPGGGGGGRGPAGGPAVGGGGLLSRLPNFVKVAGGVTALAGAFYELTKAADNLSKSRGLDIANQKIQRLVEKRDMQGLLNLKKYMQDFGGNNKDFIREVDKGINAVNRLDDADIHRMTNSIDQDYNRLKHESKVTFQRVSSLANYHFDLIERTTKHGSRAAAEASERNFGRARKAIQSAMKAGTIDTKKGLALIEALWVRALQGFGFSPKAARNLARRTPGSKQTPGANGELRPNARGGLYQIGRKGQRGPDSVPMNLGGVPSIVAPGEQIAVFNDHQQRKFAHNYPGGLEGFFSGPQPKHYQAGGIVPVPGFPGERAASSVIPMIEQIAKTWRLILTDAYGQGHQSPGHTVTGTAADFAGPDRAMDAAVAALVKMGYLVGYDGRFGSQAWPGHGPSYVAGSNAHFHVELGGKGGEALAAALAPQIDRVVMQGDLGVVSTAGQQALDTAQAAANANLNIVADAALSAPTAGGHGVSVNDGQIRDWITSALKITGQPTSGGAVSTLYGRLMQESAGNPRAINLWDSNAKAGHPSKGLMQLIDSTFSAYHVAGTSNNIYDPIANIAAAIKYMMAVYGHLVGPSATGYAKGGIVTMGSQEWARGGKIEQPTLLTGEDKGKHPEFVVGTNPMFRSTNLDALRAAADALGVPQARKSHKHKSKKKNPGQSMGAVIENVGPAGKEIVGLRWVKRYTALQQDEEDTNRKISIANSKVKEPDSLIKVVGKDDAGNDLYALDTDAISTYTTQLNAVKTLYDHLMSVMQHMVTVAQKAYVQLTNYISNRNDNIGALKNNVRTDRWLRDHSKDADTRRTARKRLAKEEPLLEREITRRDNAKQANKDIHDDQHDAFFRTQEYGVDFGDLKDTIAAVQGNAAADLTAANPQPDDTGTTDTGGPSVLEQIATFSTARQDLYSQMGSNFTDVVQGLQRAVGAGVPPAPTVYGSTATAVAAPMPTNTSSTSDVLQGGSLAAARARSQPAASQVSVASALGDAIAPAIAGAAAGSIGAAGGTSVHVEQINFPVAPTDPHTFSKNLLWELQSIS